MCEIKIQLILLPVFNVSMSYRRWKVGDGKRTDMPSSVGHGIVENK